MVKFVDDAFQQGQVYRTSHRKHELRILIHSGRFWLGEKFDLTLDRPFGFRLPGVKSAFALKKMMMMMMWWWQQQSIIILFKTSLTNTSIYKKKTLLLGIRY